MKRVLAPLAIASVSLVGIASLQWPRLRTQLGADEPDRTEQIQAAERLQRDRLQLRKVVPAFGFDNLVSGWTFLNFLYYFGNREARQLTGYGVTPAFFDVITQRDPYFRLSYQFLSSSVTLFAGQPAETVALLERGIAAMDPTFPPDSFWLWRYKAVDELLFLGDVEAAVQSLEQAAVWASQSPVPSAERSAQRARQTAAFLRQDPDSREVRANAWRLVWANAVTEEVRQYVQTQIEALGYRVRRDGESLRIEDIETRP